MDRYRPWQRLPDVRCDRCEQAATLRVVGGDVVRTGTNSVQFVNDPTVAGLSCVNHVDAIGDQIFEEVGGSCSEPLRDSWRYWFLKQFPLTRWLDPGLAHLHNRRARRRFDRAMLCDHDLSESRTCPKCGMTVIELEND